MTAYLISLSIVLLLIDRLGLTLTSINHGYNLSSINTSKPNNSKQCLRCSFILLTDYSIYGSTEIHVFIIRSYIWLFRMLSQSRPNSLYFFYLYY